MKKISLYIVSALLFLGGTSSCDYLDIVPDNTVEITSMFENRDKAYAALSQCYYYVPDQQFFHQSINMAGDEFVGRLDSEVANNRGYTRGTKLMRGWQNTSDPILSFWNGAGGARSLYQGIRYCNIFLENINAVPNMTEEEKVDCIAQAKMLKAYYHFFLIRTYGPIVIADKNLETSASVADVRQERKPVDVCFQYVVDLIDNVLYQKDADGNVVAERSDLPDIRSTSLLGQIDRIGAKAIKAQVLLYAASPLFNGNSEFYSNFKGKNGELLFNIEYDKEKWKKALDAIDEAITYAESKGKKLYKYEGSIKSFDQDDWYGENGDGVGASEIIKYCYNNRFSITDPWNDELLWGYSDVNNSDGKFSSGTQMRTLASPGTASFAYQWVGASYRMLELFHTKNGVPIDEDRTWDYENRLELVTLPNDTYHKGYIQPGETSVSLVLNREPRFYAWMAFDRGIWRTHDLKNDLKMRYGEMPGGRTASHGTDYYWTGIAIKKLVHPESSSGAWQRIVKFPYPMLRLADLYLMYAEAYNEYYGPDQKVYDKLNAIRERAGLPKIEDVWNNPNIVTSVGKHLTQDGLREIIHKERQIELCFEGGHRYFDILRWKRANEFFTSPVQGWQAREGSTLETFYQLTTWQTREWQTPRDYLFPIPLTDMDRNPNLVQNPGWK